MTQQLLMDDSPAAEDLSHVTPDVPHQVPATVEMNPLMLLERAVDRGMEPAQLKALVDLHEQWRAARAKEAFAAAMNAVQAQMPTVVRDATNSKTESRYVRLETLTHQVKPIYTAHGFALSFSEAECPREGWKRIVCHITHTAGHTEQRFMDLPVDGIGPKGNPIGGMNAVQGAISTGSYGQRVLTCRVFNITVANTDLDGEAPNPPANPEAPKAQPRGKREPEVTAQQLKHVTAQWQAKNPDPDGNVERQRQAFCEWARTVAGRTFLPAKVAEWTTQDYWNCCDALGIPTLEDLQRDANG